MFVTAVYGETPVNTFSEQNVFFELVRCPATIWCGAIGYAPACAGEPDIGGLLRKYQQQCQIPKVQLAAPGWSGCISIDYWQNGAVPRGMMFMQQVLTAQQDPAHDVYTMPESLYLRVARTKENAQAAFGRDKCDLWELFGVIRQAMAAHGYAINPNGAQEMELYCHAEGRAYAYVPVVEK